MAEKEAKAQDEGLDENGLVIHRYQSTVLVVVPVRDFAETTLRYARSALFNVHVHSHSVSVDDSGLIQGTLQDEFQVDQALDASISMEDYSGVIFCGGPGALEMADHPEVQRLAKEAAEAGKLIAAWGDSTAVLAKSGVARGKRVTGNPALQELLKSSGAKYVRTQVQVDGSIVTAVDDSAGFRFAKSLVQVLSI